MQVLFDQIKEVSGGVPYIRRRYKSFLISCIAWQLFSYEQAVKADREYPPGEVIIKTGKEFQEDMADTRTDELYRALQDKGYPDELCREIAYKHMNTDYTATRMLGYLYRVTSPRVEDVIDEMLAILSDRESIIRKKELEHAQATINSVYREGL